MSPADDDPPESGRRSTGRGIEPTADSVLDQLRRLEAAWQFDMTPAAREIDAVAEAVDGLRTAIERAPVELGDSGEEDLDELLRTREQLAEAMVLAERFLRMLGAGGPGRPDA